jgi:small subunit ribosomal protein S9
MTKKQNYIYAVGRRKSASARTRLFKGKGENLVNEISFSSYFSGKIFETRLERFLKLIGPDASKYYFTFKVDGGGKSSQFEACLLGLARAFSQVSEDMKLKLKKEGFLTRDARIRERRKIGTGGKARRKKQSPKR